MHRPPSPRRRLGWMLTGWMVVAVVAFGLAAMLAALLDCDTDGLLVLVSAGGAAAALAAWWPQRAGLRGWTQALAVIAAAAVVPVAAFSGWATVALTRCWTF